MGEVCEKNITLVHSSWEQSGFFSTTIVLQIIGSSRKRRRFGGDSERKKNFYMNTDVR